MSKQKTIACSIWSPERLLEKDLVIAIDSKQAPGRGPSTSLKPFNIARVVHAQFDAELNQIKIYF